MVLKIKTNKSLHFVGFLVSLQPKRDGINNIRSKMKLNSRRWMLLVALCIGMLTTVGVRAQVGMQKRQITIGLDANYAPLQSVDKNGLPHGYDVTFTRTLMSRMGVDFYYVPNSWKNTAWRNWSSSAAPRSSRRTTTPISSTEAAFSGPTSAFWT